MEVDDLGRVFVLAPHVPISSSSWSQKTESNLRKILLKTPMRVLRIASRLLFGRWGWKAICPARSTPSAR